MQKDYQYKLPILSWLPTVAFASGAIVDRIVNSNSDSWLLLCWLALITAVLGGMFVLALLLGGILIEVGKRNVDPKALREAEARRRGQ